VERIKIPPLGRGGRWGLNSKYKKLSVLIFNLLFPLCKSRFFCYTLCYKERWLL